METADQRILKSNLELQGKMSRAEIDFRYLMGKLATNTLVEFARPILVTPAYSCCGYISSAMIEIEDSPVIDRLVLLWAAYERNPSKAFIISLRGTRLVAENDDDASESVRDSFKIILAFWDSLRVPTQTPMKASPADGTVSIMKPVPSNSATWIPFENQQESQSKIAERP